MCNANTVILVGMRHASKEALISFYDRINAAARSTLTDTDTNPDTHTDSNTDPDPNTDPDSNTDPDPDNSHWH